MDVALAADGGRVAEARRDALDGVPDVALGRRLGGEALAFLERQRGQHGAGPGAEVLGRDVGAGDLPHVLVDVV